MLSPSNGASGAAPVHAPSAPVRAVRGTKSRTVAPVAPVAPRLSHWLHEMACGKVVLPLGGGWLCACGRRWP